MRNLNWWKKSAFVVVLFLLFSMNLWDGQKVNADMQQELPTTGFEDSEGEEWTTHEEELAFIKEVAEQSE